MADYKKLPSHEIPDGIAMDQLLTGPMDGDDGSLFRSATEITSDWDSGWPLKGGGTEKDRQAILRIFATKHYFTLGGKPDLSQLAYLRWTLNEGVKGKRANRLIDAYAQRSGQPPDVYGRERGGGGKGVQKH